MGSESLSRGAGESYVVSLNAMPVARLEAGADGVMVAARACPVLALVVAYANCNGVVVDSTQPCGYVTLTISCVESSVG